MFSPDRGKIAITSSRGRSYAKKSHPIAAAGCPVDRRALARGPLLGLALLSGPVLSVLDRHLREGRKQLDPDRRRELPHGRPQRQRELPCGLHDLERPVERGLHRHVSPLCEPAWLLGLTGIPPPGA